MEWTRSFRCEALLALSVLVAAAQEPKDAAPLAEKYVAGTEGLTWVDDVDGDRIPDLVGSSRTFPSSRPENAQIIFRSGSDGRALRRVDISALMQFTLGHASVGDYDRDGSGDVLVDGLTRGGFTMRGVFLVSGRTGDVRSVLDQGSWTSVSVPRQVVTFRDSSEVGGLVAISGLLRRDAATSSFDPSPSVSLVSLESGQVLRRIPQPSHDGTLPVGGEFGAALAVLSSHKLGVTRIAVGAPRYGNGLGTVEVFELGSGERRWCATGPEGASQFGSTLLAVGDVDKDGEEDLFVGGTGDGVCLLSGDDGALLGSCAAPWNGTRDDGFGHSLALIGDVNGDGVRDVAVGSYEGFGGSDTDWVEILSGRDASKLARVENVGESIVAASPHGDWTCVEPSSGVLRCYDGRTLALRFTVRE